MESSVLSLIFANMDHKKYNNTKLFFSIASSVVSICLLIFLILSGLNSKALTLVSAYTNNMYMQFLLFILVVGGAFKILFLPIDIYTGFILEHKYNLSNQSFLKWGLEELKGLAVGLPLGLGVALFFYYTLISFTQYWWLPFAVFLFILSVVLARIVPVFIMPLFYKITPIEDEELKRRISEAGRKSGMAVIDVFKFDMSKNTKKANAAFTGLGKSKRVLLGDTLLESFTNDEIETVLAHEFGHYKKKHILINIVMGTVNSFLTLFIISTGYKIICNYFSISVTAIDSLPILLLIASFVSTIQTPLFNYISRVFEYQADRYAVETTSKPEVFVEALRKLNTQNLGDANPHPFVEWYFYSHPSITNRINAILNIN